MLSDNFDAASLCSSIRTHRGISETFQWTLDPYASITARDTGNGFLDPDALSRAPLQPDQQMHSHVNDVKVTPHQKEAQI